MNSEKKTLLIIIDDLSRGGAEILLVGILPELNQCFDVILVTLTGVCDFARDEIRCHKRYILPFRNKFSLLSCIRELKKIIRLHRPDLIHAHLFYSSLVARAACPVHIPLLYTLHSVMSRDVFDHSPVSAFLEKRTIKKNHGVIAVSQLALEDYEHKIGKNENSFVLKNYISDNYFRNSRPHAIVRRPPFLRLVAIANAKKIKNYEYLVEAFKLLKEQPVSLDIYGSTSYEGMSVMKEEIRKHALPIEWKGHVPDLSPVIPQYDIFVSSSLFEGFGVAAVEAMACGLPLLLSDIPVYHEVTFENALFFDIATPSSLADVIKKILKGEFDLEQLSEKGRQIALQYSKENYLRHLFSIYEKVMSAPSQADQKLSLP